MGHKEGKIEALLTQLLGREDIGKHRHYAGYFECFNRQLFYEAHEVLEEIWMPTRKELEGNFYKGLIQLAGAFVHLQKAKKDPAMRLFRMARANLAAYPAVHQRLDVAGVIGLIDLWLRHLGEGKAYRPELAPRIDLLPA